MGTPSQADLERVEATLREDIAWVRLNGPGWAPTRGVRGTAAGWTSKNGVGEVCGTCAIGAHVLRRQLPTDAPDWQVAARSLGVSPDWAIALYIAVADVAEKETRSYQCPDSAWEMAERLCAFAAEVRP